MRVQFNTSIAGATFSYIEGQTRDLPDPLPEPFLGWLRDGTIKPVKVDEPEIALAPDAVERAVSRRGRAARTRKRAARAMSRADGCP